MNWPVIWGAVAGFEFTMACLRASQGRAWTALMWATCGFLIIAPDLFSKRHQ